MLSQVSGQPIAFEISSQLLPTTGSDLWYTVVAGGAAHGEMTLRLAAASGTRLAKKFLGETEPAAAGISAEPTTAEKTAPENIIPEDITPEDKEALEELLRQIAVLGGHHRLHSPGWVSAPSLPVRRALLVVGGIAGHRHDLHANHMSRRRIGAVRRGRNETHRAVRIATAPVVCANRKQASILALRSGVGLQRDGVIAGDPKARLQISDQLRITGSLLARRKRMQRAKPGQVTGVISEVALSFMVQEPSGIMVRSSARSRSASRRR